MELEPPAGSTTTSSRQRPEMAWSGLVLSGPDCGLTDTTQHSLIKFSPDKTDSNWLGIKCLATNEQRSYLSQTCFIIQTNSDRTSPVQPHKKCDKVIKNHVSRQSVSFVFQSREAISLREGSNL